MEEDKLVFQNQPHTITDISTGSSFTKVILKLRIKLKPTLNGLRMTIVWNFQMYDTI